VAKIIGFVMKPPQRKRYN